MRDGILRVPGRELETAGFRQTSSKAHSPPCVTHRTLKGCLSNKTELAMITKLAETPRKAGRLDDYNHMPKSSSAYILRRNRGGLPAGSSRCRRTRVT